MSAPFDKVDVYTTSDITREACSTDSDRNHLYPQPLCFKSPYYDDQYEWERLQNIAAIIAELKDYHL